MGGQFLYLVLANFCNLSFQGSLGSLAQGGENDEIGGGPGCRVRTRQRRWSCPVLPNGRKLLG